MPVRIGAWHTPWTINYQTMALWFECKVRYDKMQENGTIKKVNEPYLVDALTFTEAEARIMEEMKRSFPASTR